MQRASHTRVGVRDGDVHSHRNLWFLPLAWRDYVEEDQEEKGQDASLKGQPR
jgi:hypothetical protein